MVAVVAVLVFFQVSGMETSFGHVPSPSASFESAFYYLGGVGLGLCFGVLGIALAAGAGALTGAFGVRAPVPVPVPLDAAPYLASPEAR
jgi:hypothetical protein